MFDGHRVSAVPNNNANRPSGGSVDAVQSSVEHFLPQPAVPATGVQRLQTAASEPGDQPPDAEPLTDNPARIESDFAGLFFLLTVFSALGLFGDFTNPRSRIPGLSPFELMVMLGRRWFGASFERDPLAALLRSLAGIGPSARVGRHFEAPVWDVRAEWLAPWPSSGERTIGGSRWHQAGFPISDNPDVNRTPVALRRRWVYCLARFLEARLARALGTTDRRQACATLARRQGQISLVGDQISVAFNLNDHPIELRLAGLDRDMGWVPAAGPSVGFVFK